MPARNAACTMDSSLRLGNIINYFRPDTIPLKMESVSQALSTRAVRFIRLAKHTATRGNTMTEGPAGEAAVGARKTCLVLQNQCFSDIFFVEGESMLALPRKSQRSCHCQVRRSSLGLPKP